ncbi:MAG: hypothetical protein QF619_14385, partial [Candidatus Binatia bacterium]|nr:hypothetical protein [Candidatus Binatia bacterium]
SSRCIIHPPSCFYDDIWKKEGWFLYLLLKCLKGSLHNIAPEPVVHFGWKTRITTGVGYPYPFDDATGPNLFRQRIQSTD